MKNILITGGAGFIGANFIRAFLAQRPQWRLVNLDALTYAGNLANLADLPPEQQARHHFVHGDIRDGALLARLFKEYASTGVIHFAAESHVECSITAPQAFVDTNVGGTCTLLQAALAAWQEQGRPADFCFHHVSTDEVYDSLGSPQAPSAKPRPMPPPVPIQPPRRTRTILSGPTAAPMACPSSSPTVPIITGPASFRKSSFLGHQ